MKFRTNKFRIFWNIGGFCCKIRKKSDSKLEISDIFLNFLSKTPPRRGLFFRKKRSSDLAQTSRRWSSDKINFELFGTFAIFVGKLEKNPIPSWKIFKKKFLWSCSKLAQMKFRQSKFRIISNIRDFFWKVGKKFDSKVENLQGIFYIKFLIWNFPLKWTQRF